MIQFSITESSEARWRTASGWVVGGGIEVALNARWSAKLESLYIDAGNSQHTNVPPEKPGPASPDTTRIPESGYSAKSTADN